jgi:hypothetical protein
MYFTTKLLLLPILGAFISSAAFTGIAHADLLSETSRLLHHGNPVMNAIDLDQMGLSASSTEVQPWGSSYWPDGIGGIATRYGTHGIAVASIGTVLSYPFSRAQWKNRNASMRARAQTLSEDDIAQNLAPSEKYDLLMGDLDFRLTNNIIEEIDYRYHHKIDTNGNWIEKDGMVSWVGICDGWTSASLHTPRPVKTIKVKGATGQIITFYPDDLKALASHLFARTNQWLGVERVGNRCAGSGAPVDQFGRPSGVGCNDIEASLWHTTVLNRIGIDRRGFIIDQENDFRVGNHPVYSYETIYFNPNSGVTGTLLSTAIPISQVDDGLQPLRHPEATLLVGVKMKIHMLDYIWPTGKATDSESNDKTKDQTYIYDLEMTSDGTIVGGQWHRNRKKFLFFGSDIEAQPDMMWMLAPNQLAWSFDSAKADEGPILDPTNPMIWSNIAWKFKGDGNIPVDWFNVNREDATYFKWPEAHPYSMIQSAHPLAEMVYYLMDQAKQ